MFDEDADIDDICKIGYFEQLYQTYNERFEKQFEEAFSLLEEPREFLSESEEDTLLF